jgi:hypothetical protein
MMEGTEEVELICDLSVYQCRTRRGCDGKLVSRKTRVDLVQRCSGRATSLAAVSVGREKASIVDVQTEMHVAG